jgi:hypothetical protein
VIVIDGRDSSHTATDDRDQTDENATRAREPIQHSSSFQAGLNENVFAGFQKGKTGVETRPSEEH